MFSSSTQFIQELCCIDSSLRPDKTLTKPAISSGDLAAMLHPGPTNHVWYGLYYGVSMHCGPETILGHDDVIAWGHLRGTNHFPEEFYGSPGNYPHKGLVVRSCNDSSIVNPHKADELSHPDANV